MHAWGFEAIGTAWQIDTREPVAPDVRTAVLDRIEEFDRAWSRFRPDSLVTQMSERAGTWTLPDEASQLLGFYAELHDVSDGAVNPLIGRTLSDLGYDADYSLVASVEPAGVPPWSSIELSEGVLTTTRPVLLDVGAAGKGLLVDLVAGIVGRETHQFTVDASGDLYHGGATPLRIALEHPLDPTRAIGIAEIDPEDALCASATNRRAWGDGLHHVVDARTGRPTDDVIATWVVVPQSCMRADGLATAHFFTDPVALMERFQHQFVRMHADGRVQWSPDFPGEIFT
ncbi:FAD:protein FMN transferase [Aeromicrobium fastidiosum]|uniref:FAD:protein FMN transferase n=1 Tax=Aeromicrobium fastidiosum TaxID=52699 RepID=UPI001D94DE73|nr:FAD:protein FMN transferase [Aeromicrobium fastidiosum]MBP2389575.1 thiamine biosynthesis lipoprotein [Aeromicrobium fastidiosum]